MPKTDAEIDRLVETVYRQIHETGSIDAAYKLWIMLSIQLIQLGFPITEMDKVRAHREGMR